MPTLLFQRRCLLAFLSVILLYGCVRDQSNKSFSLDEYRGRWVVLNYWATWCAPCIKEIPELNELAREHPEELVVLGFNYDEPDGEQFAEDIHSMGIRFQTIAENPAQALKLSRPEGLPVTYLFTPQGELAAKLVGPQTKESLLTRIETLEKHASEATESL